MKWCLFRYASLFIFAFKETCKDREETVCNGGLCGSDNGIVGGGNGVLGDGNGVHGGGNGVLAGVNGVLRSNTGFVSI